MKNFWDIIFHGYEIYTADILFSCHKFLPAVNVYEIIVKH